MPVKIWRRKGLLINGSLVVILIAVGVTSYLVIRPTRSSTTRATSTVQQGTVLATVSASGTLEAKQNLGLNFTTGGKVTAIYVTVGQRVKAGQVLAKVDPTASKDSLTQAQAQLSAAQAQLAAAEQGETSAAKQVQADQAAQSQQQVQTAESNLAAAEQAAADDAASAQQSVTAAQDTLGYAEQALSADESKLGSAEATLTTAENQLASDEAAEQTACAGAGSTSSACTSAEAAVAADKTNVANDTSAVSAGQSAVQAQQETVTNAQNGVTAAQDSEKTTEDRDKAAITSDKQAVASAEKAYKTTLASNVASATPNQTTIAQDTAAVTNDSVVVEEDKQAVAGTTLSAPFGGTVASVSSAVGQVVSSTSSGSTGSTASGTSGSSASEAAAAAAAGPGTGIGGANTTNQASGFIVLTDLSNLLVQATFDETDAASLRLGAAATVTPEGVTGASELSATVAEIDPTSTTTSGVVNYGVTLALSQHDAGLKPGESVSVSVITGKANNALYVPATAVTTSGTTSTVVVVGPNNTERTVAVTLGVQGSTDDQILTGLTLGEQVLTSTATASTGGTGFPFGGRLGGGLGGGLVGGRGGGRG